MATLINTVDHMIAREVSREHGNAPDQLLEILHGVQHAEGYLSETALITIADAINVSRADVHGVVSFYHDFKRRPQARQTLKICRAESCQAMGANALIADAEKAFGTKLDMGGKDIALEAAYCLGNCALSPAVMVDETLYGRVDIERLKKISAVHRDGAMA